MYRFEDIHVFHYATHAIVWHVIADTDENTAAMTGSMSVPAPDGYRWQLIFCDMFLRNSRADVHALSVFETSCQLDRYNPGASVTLYVNGVAIRQYNGERA